MAPGEQVCFDEENLAAHLGHRHSGGHACGQFLTRFLRKEFRAAEIVVHDFRIDRYLVGLALRNLERDLPGDAADGSFQLANAGLTRVARGDQGDGAVADLDVFRRQPVFLNLPWRQIALGDFEFLPVAVTRQRNYVHAIPQRRRNRAELVGGRNKQDFRKIERQIEVMISEGVILFRVENLEQCRRRIAAVISAQLVDLVEHHHGIVDARAANRLNHAARHRAHVSAAMAAQFGFITHAAQAEPLKMAVHRAGNRSAQRSLAYTWRAHETKNRTLGVGA